MLAVKDIYDCGLEIIRLLLIRGAIVDVVYPDRVVTHNGLSHFTPLLWALREYVDWKLRDDSDKEWKVKASFFVCNINLLAFRRIMAFRRM